MKTIFKKSPLSLAIFAAIGAGSLITLPIVANAANKTPGKYLSGDFHNHSTCSDGGTSMQKKIKKSTDTIETPWGLDWFVQAGHGGSGNRNCTLVEDASLETPAYPVVYDVSGNLQGPSTTWLNTNVTPPIEIKGRVQGTGANRVMWRWQAVQEFQYPLVEYLKAYNDIPLFIGVESVAPGHEHISMSVISGQIPQALDTVVLPSTPGYDPVGNAEALAKWEYCFDRNDTDNSRGNRTGTNEGNNWDCSVPGSLNQNDPSWVDAAKKLDHAPPSAIDRGIRGHNKAIESVKWMAAFHPDTSYYVPAHLERPGPFNPNGNNGYNVEHLRNFNNAAPNIAVGFESQPGHGAASSRGEYRPNRNNFGDGGPNVDSVGGTTYGGTGVYAAQVGGVWDALLGEGRNWWFFGSSDWHNRGSFGFDDSRSTFDFYPGEYQRDYIMVRNGSDKVRPQTIVDGIRSGNSWVDSGQLIDRLAFVACIGNPARHGRSDKAVETLSLNAALNNTDLDFKGCATMGEKLVVPAGSDIVVSIVVRDPSGQSYSPYSFENPSLKQISISQPLNQPVLDHVDVIHGLVTGYKQPTDTDYAGEWPRDWLQKVRNNEASLDAVPAGAKNTTASVIKTYNESTWQTAKRDREFKTMTFRIPAITASQYVRLRGTNLPAGVPFETDADGNPLPDYFTNSAQNDLKIPCDSSGENVPPNEVLHKVGDAPIDGCPNHLPVINGVKYVARDVAAWSDLWFYSNPIFIEVQGAAVVAGVDAADDSGLKPGKGSVVNLAKK